MMSLKTRRKGKEGLITVGVSKLVGAYPSAGECGGITPACGGNIHMGFQVKPKWCELN